MMHVAANPRERNKVTEVFSEAAANGLTVCRTWAFTDGGGNRALQLSPGVYDERVFEVVNLAHMSLVNIVVKKHALIWFQLKTGNGILQL